MQSLRLAAKWLHKTKSSPQGDTSYSYLNSHISDLRSTLKKIDLISISLAPHAGYPSAVSQMMQKAEHRKCFVSRLTVSHLSAQMAQHTDFPFPRFLTDYSPAPDTYHARKDVSRQLSPTPYPVSRNWRKDRWKDRRAAKISPRPRYIWAKEEKSNPS